jgi:hypothetical protein
VKVYYSKWPWFNDVLYIEGKLITDLIENNNTIWWSVSTSSVVSTLNKKSGSFFATGKVEKEEPGQVTTTPGTAVWGEPGKVNTNPGSAVWDGSSNWTDNNMGAVER